MNLTKKQIDHIVNVNGLKPPRTKNEKAIDKLLFQVGYKRKGNIQKAIYQTVKETI